MSKLEGYSVKLPFVYGTVDGPYQLTKSLGEVERQNLKNLMLTNPGARVMMPTFGVGLSRVLFGQAHQSTYDEISSRIYAQVSQWLPFVNLVSVEFIDHNMDTRVNPNELQIIIAFSFGSLNQEETLKITTVIN